MPRLQAKSFAKPDDVRSMPLMRVETISLDETQVGHCSPARASDAPRRLFRVGMAGRDG
jgi:hypothetical protein